MGTATVEDRFLRRVGLRILSAICEQDLVECSRAYRLGRKLRTNLGLRGRFRCTVHNILKCMALLGV